MAVASTSTAVLSAMDLTESQSDESDAKSTDHKRNASLKLNPDAVLNGNPQAIKIAAYGMFV